MINRPDGRIVLGGDTVQMQKTAEHLRERGVVVDESFGPPSDEQLAQADVVHLFNLQTPDFTLGEAQRAAGAGKPIVLSTIFWDFGADQLLAKSSLWSNLAKIVGRKLARRLAQRRVDSASKPARDKVREILRLAVVSLPNSNAEVDQLKIIQPSLGLTKVVPNAVEPERHRPDRDLALPGRLEGTGVSSKGYVLIAARIEPDKNQLEFCRAIRGHSKAVLMCGPAHDPPYVEACRNAGAIVIESLSGNDLDAAMLHAKVHALPSYRETPGLASLEAAAMGCAIVTTEIGSAREYFLDEAEYCVPWSHVSMRSAVERAWTKGPPPGLSERIRKRFCWEEAARITHEAYEEAMASQG